MGGISIYLLCAVVNEYGYNMADLRKDEEDGGVYDGESDMYGE